MVRIVVGGGGGKKRREKGENELSKRSSKSGEEWSAMEMEEMDESLLAGGVYGVGRDRHMVGVLIEGENGVKSRVKFNKAVQSID